LQVQVLVKPGAKVNRVIRHPDGSFTVTVTTPPIEGKANQAVITALAQFLRVPKSTIRLIAGARSRRKIFIIPGREPDKRRT
jgi:uncharacterized protein YggU (UPF0235/DUF167 family)